MIALISTGTVACNFSCKYTVVGGCKRMIMAKIGFYYVEEYMHKCTDDFFVLFLNFFYLKVFFTLQTSHNSPSLPSFPLVLSPSSPHPTPYELLRKGKVSDGESIKSGISS